MPMPMLKRLAFLFVMVAGSLAAKQCTEGGCCDIKTGKFKPAGTTCADSKHDCLESVATCDGFNAKCNRKNKADGTKCPGGKCKSGACVKTTEKKVAKKETKKATKTTKKDTKIATTTKGKKAEKKSEKKAEKKIEKKAALKTAKAPADVKKSEKKIEKKQEKKAEKKADKAVLAVLSQPRVVAETVSAKRSSTRDLQPKDAVKTLVDVAMQSLAEQKIIDELRKQKARDTERAEDYFVGKMLKKTVSQIVERNSPSKRLTSKMSAHPSAEEKQLNDMLMKEPRNRMKFFQGLTRQMLKVNRDQFYKHLENKETMADKYANDIAKEHAIIGRQIQNLEDVGYYSNKYYTFPTITPTANTTTSSESKSLMASLFQGKSGGVNLFAIIIAGVAVLAVVVLIVALVSRKKDQKKPKKEEFEKF